jgi:hypothetical protein
MARSQKTGIIVIILILSLAILISIASPQSEIKSQKAEIELEYFQAKIAAKIQGIPWRQKAIKYTWICMLAASSLSLLVFASLTGWGKLRQASIIEQEIGESSKIKMHFALAKRPEMIELTAGMIHAHGLKADNPDKYLEFSEKVMMRLSPYRQSVTISNAQGGQIAIPAHATNRNIPTFRELLSNGTIAHGKPLVFGYAHDGAPVTGSWEDAYSCGIGGQSGFGKTATIRSLMAQSLVNGSVSDFYVIDPHYPHPKSLLSSLGSLKDSEQVHYADTPFDISEMIAGINTCIDRRFARQEPSFPVKIVIIDEVMSIINKIPAIKKLVERVGCESRKAGFYGVFASQSWVGQKTGGTTARDNLACILAHRMKKGQANTLLQDTESAKMVQHLEQGQALFAPTSLEAQIITIPYCKAEDMSNVVEVLKQANGHPYFAPQNNAHVARIDTGATNAEETIEHAGTQEKRVETQETQETQETPFLIDLSKIREIIKKQIETKKETWGSLYTKTGFNRGGIHKVIIKGDEPSVKMHEALSKYVMSLETLETPVKTGRNNLVSFEKRRKN